jgi:hypothetical protein
MKNFIKIDTTQGEKVLIPISEIQLVRPTQSLQHSGCVIFLRNHEIETHATLITIQAEIQKATS